MIKPIQFAIEIWSQVGQGFFNLVSRTHFLPFILQLKFSYNLDNACNFSYKIKIMVAYLISTWQFMVLLKIVDPYFDVC